MAWLESLIEELPGLQSCSNSEDGKEYNSSSDSSKSDDSSSECSNAEAASTRQLRYVEDLADLEEDYRPFVLDEDSRDRLEFPWLVEDALKDARSHIGDALAMKAEYILARSQPYPGDEMWVAEDRGVLNRFKVTRKDEETD